MEMMKVFAYNIKKYRKIKRFSQMKLAEMINTSTSYIGEIEINNKSPSMEMVEKIAEALDIEPFRLFLDDLNRKSDKTQSNEIYYERLTTVERQNLSKKIYTAILSDLENILHPETKI